MIGLPKKVYVLIFTTGHIYTQRDLPVLFGEGDMKNVPQWIEDVNGRFVEVKMKFEWNESTGCQ